MNAQRRNAGYRYGPQQDEELAGILVAISVVTKRMARRLSKLSRQTCMKKRGGKYYGKTRQYQRHCD